MVNSKISSGDIKKGYSLDGFPRTLDQVKGLSAVPADEEIAVFLRVDEDIIVNRILSRLSCGNCGEIFNTVSQPPARENICNKCGTELTKRNDDTEEIIKKRIIIYREETLPVINYYRGKGNLHELDASRDIKEVWAKIRELVK